MQFLQIGRNATLNSVRDAVGSSNLETVLAVNSLQRTPNIGEQLNVRSQQIIHSSQPTTKEFKINALGKASGDSDVFESMALMGESGWMIYHDTDALPNTLVVPESVTLAKSEDVLGNGQRVSNEIYNETIASLKDSGEVDPEIFNTYSSEKSTKIATPTSKSYSNLYEFFKIPWGNMSIYSSLSNEMKDFPVYPEEFSDAVRANYTTMPELIYQYEPWQLYTSSGPRSNTYTFTFHRDMWTGDHRDGKANELVRFCEANCYPEYNGSAVNTALSSLYVNGKLLIRGVITEVSKVWSGPLGLDEFPLVCKLAVTFIEVSPYPLDYWTVKSKPLVG